MKRTLLLLPLLLVSCESDERAAREHAAYCKSYDETVASLTSDAIYQTNKPQQLIQAMAALDYIDSHKFDSQRGQYCDLHDTQSETLRRVAAAATPIPIATTQPVQQQELKQGESSHPVAGAAIGAGAAWLLLGGPVAVGLGAIAGAVIGSN